MLTEKFSWALELARQVHEKQKRRGVDVPYLAHLMGVCALVLNDGGTEAQAIAALLHDTVEDHADQISFEDIVLDFGDEIAGFVQACTEPAGLKGTWREIKQGYIDHIVQAPPQARRIILADKLDNARSVQMALIRWGDDYWKGFESPTRADVRWYQQALKDALATWEATPLHQEFDALVDALDPILG